MRSVHLIRSYTALVGALIAVCLAGAVPASALSIKYPTDGRMVRDKVAIIVPKSSLPSGTAASGFLVLKVDGHFVCANAVDGSGTAEDQARSDVSVLWDTRQPIKESKLPVDQREYLDGHHEILIEAHGSKDRGKDAVLESAKVDVVLQNQVQRPNPAPPLKLRYRYHTDQENQFRVRTSGELLNNMGESLTGGHMPVLGEFSVVQSVEDVQRDGAAMLRYKVNKDAFVEVFRKVTMLGYGGQKLRSVYKIVSNTGEILKSNVLSLKSDIHVTDCLVDLPSRPVQVGEDWPCSFTLKLEGLADPVTFTGKSKLASVEWDGGYKCAKIVSTMSGAPAFNFLKDQVGTVEATSVAYFAYESGKLIENTITMEFDTLLDQSSLSSLQQETSLASGADSTSSAPVAPSSSYNPYVSPSTGATPAPGSSSMAGAASRYAPSGSYKPSASSGPTSSGTDSGGDKTQVSIRMIVLMQLQR